jgi:DNA topoisomerase-2
MEDSTMDDSVFDDYGDSDAFSPVAAPVSPPLKDSMGHDHSILTCAPQKPKAKPAIKKAVAPKAPKATTKKMIQTTLKAAKPATKKRAKPESDDEDPPSEDDPFGDNSVLSNTPPSAKKQKKIPEKKSTAAKPLQDVENESMNLDGPSEKGPAKKKSATDQYQKLTHLQHIIKRPDTYIGSVEQTTEQMWGKLSELWLVASANRF